MSILDCLLPQSPPEPKGARRILGQAGLGFNRNENPAGNARKNARDRRYYERHKERLNAKRREV